MKKHSKDKCCAYDGSKFRLTANPHNELELLIIEAFKFDKSLQERLEFEDSNQTFHANEWCIGQHIEEGVEYIRRMAARYEGWKRDEPLLVPVCLLHDICKADEKFYGHDRERNPETHHAVLAYELAQVLLDIDNGNVLKLVKHHDDHYRLYRDREFFPGKKIINLFKNNFQDFNEIEMETLIRFGFVDRYRRKPKDKRDLVRYNDLKKIYKKETNWFMEIAKKSHLVDKHFIVFS